MIKCPYCGAENIEGVDHCQECGQSLSDLYIAIPRTEVERSLSMDRIAELDPNAPVTVPPSTPVGDVLNQMVSASIGCVMVVEDGSLVGIFSERDALMKLNDRAAELFDRPVSEFMTDTPQTLSSEDKIAFAVQRMDLGGYRHLPIVDEEGSTAGVISVRDILRYLTEKMSAGSAQ